VLSTNGILRNSKSIAVTVIADGKQKYGMKILRLLLWLLVLSMAAISTIPQQLLPPFSNVGTYCCDFRANPNYSVVSTNGILRNPKVLL
jgi:hypothetical protein